MITKTEVKRKARNKTNFTPRPWIVSTIGGGRMREKYQVRANPAGAFGAQQFTVTLDRLADARLIAASPQMFQVLKHLGQQISGGALWTKHLSNSDASLIQEVIDRAEGKA